LPGYAPPGYAVTFEESEIGLGAVGMAVLDTYGRPPAGVTVAGVDAADGAGYVQAIVRELRRPVAAASAECCRSVRADCIES
jgi:DNA-binding IclR family transcriptional regulator